jgi:hypothetical protein
MNVPRHNQDLQILMSPAEMARPRFGITPAWQAVDWQTTLHHGNMVYLRQYVLPPTCSLRKTDVRIEAPPNLYDVLADGGYAFYRNIWVVPGLELWDSRRKRWAKVPRLFEQSGSDGFAYLCIHPGRASEKETILDFLRVLDLHLLNPGLHATAGEAL